MRFKQEKDMCPVCEEEFMHEEMVDQLSCNEHHIYHHECIESWIAHVKSVKNSPPTCPQCRARFEENKTVKRKYIDPQFKALKDELKKHDSDPFYQGPAPGITSNP